MPPAGAAPPRVPLDSIIEASAAKKQLNFTKLTQFCCQTSGQNRRRCSDHLSCLFIGNNDCGLLVVTRVILFISVDPRGNGKTLSRLLKSFAVLALLIQLLSLFRVHFCSQLLGLFCLLSFGIGFLLSFDPRSGFFCCQFDLFLSFSLLLLPLISLQLSF